MTYRSTRLTIYWMNDRRFCDAGAAPEAASISPCASLRLDEVTFRELRLTK